MKRLSVPERSRSMFALCRYTMTPPAMSEATTTAAGGCRISHTPSGNVPAARIEPAEMCRVAATVITKTIRTASSGTVVR